MRGIHIVLGLSGALATLGGIAMLLGPAGFLASQGIDGAAAVTLVVQAQGAVLVALGAINLLAVRVTDARGLQAVCAGNLLTHVVALAVNVRGLTQQLVGNAVMVDVVVHVLFGAAFGWAMWILASGPAGERSV